MDDKIKNPPFDGSELCPFCPVEIRNLHATAHNAVNAFKHSDPSRVNRKMNNLALAVEECRPLVDKHFSDTLHSKGTISQS